MKKAILFVALAVLFIAISAQFQQPQKPDVVEGELLVKFKPTISAQAVDALIADVGAQTVNTFSQIGVRQMKLPAGMTLDDGLKRFRASKNVAYVEPNYIWHALKYPSDPDFDKLWGLHNIGQTGGQNDADIDALEAWDVETGSDSVLIGVIDTGVDIGHEDLAANIWTNPGEDAWANPIDPNSGNGTDDDGNGKVDDWKGWNFIAETNNAKDDHYHGTHCAGTIGAIGGNGKGVAGVNWKVKILPLKFLDSQGSGSTTDAVEAILYAVQMNVDILSNSWGGGGFSQTLEDAISVANNAGVLFVVAAGNDGVNTDSSPTYPACYDVANILSVAASDHNDKRALWSGGGGGCGFSCGGIVAPGSNYGARTVDIAAPGKDIYSTVPGGYNTLSGTSMATPHVAGAAGLVLAHFPNLTHLQLKQKLMDTADHLVDFEGKSVTEGRLNVHKALTTP